MECLCSIVCTFLPWTSLSYPCTKFSGDTERFGDWGKQRAIRLHSLLKLTLSLLKGRVSLLPHHSHRILGRTEVSYCIGMQWAAPSHRTVSTLFTSTLFHVSAKNVDDSQVFSVWKYHIFSTSKPNHPTLPFLAQRCWGLALHFPNFHPRSTLLLVFSLTPTPRQGGKEKMQLLSSLIQSTINVHPKVVGHVPPPQIS